MTNSSVTGSELRSFSSSSLIVLLHPDYACPVLLSMDDVASSLFGCGEVNCAIFHSFKSSPNRRGGNSLDSLSLQELLLQVHSSLTPSLTR